MAVELEQEQLQEDIAGEQASLEGIDAEDEAVPVSEGGIEDAPAQEEAATDEAAQEPAPAEAEQTEFPPDTKYVRDLERRLREAESELSRLRFAARLDGVNTEAVLSGKAALDWKKDQLELKVVVKGVSRRYGLLQQLADLRTDPEDEEVPVRLNLRPLVAQARLGFDEIEANQDAGFRAEDAGASPETTGEVWTPGMKEPQDAPDSTDQSAEESGPEAPADEIRQDDATTSCDSTDLEAPEEGGDAGTGDNTHGEATPPQDAPVYATGVSEESPAFTREKDDYEGTGLPLYTLTANIDMQQLAEAAYQTGLPVCAIELTRDHGKGTMTVLYHYHGPGGQSPIDRIPSPIRERWIRGLREKRGATVA